MTVGVEAGDAIRDGRGGLRAKRIDGDLLTAHDQNGQRTEIATSSVSICGDCGTYTLAGEQCSDCSIPSPAAADGDGDREGAPSGSRGGRRDTDSDGVDRYVSGLRAHRHVRRGRQLSPMCGSRPRAHDVTDREGSLDCPVYDGVATARPTATPGPLAVCLVCRALFASGPTMTTMLGPAP